MKGFRPVSVIPGHTLLRRARRLGAMVLLLALPCLVLAQDAPELTRVWRQSSGFPSAPAPLASDLDLDGQLEIVQVGLNGEVTATDATDGNVLWSESLGGQQLFTPVAGHFLANDRINIFVATKGTSVGGGEEAPGQEGLCRAYVLDGPTGHIELQFNLPYPLVQPPTAFPWTNASDEENPFREGVMLYDPVAGRVRGYLLNDKYEEPLFEYETPGPLAGPPAVGRTGLPAPLPHAVFVTTDGVVTVLPLRQTSRAVSQHLVNQAQADLGVTLADLTGDGTSEVVVADKSGYLHALSVGDSGMKPVWPEGERVTIRDEPAQPPVAIDVDGDGIDDILIPRRRSYGLVNGKTGHDFWSGADGITEYLQSGNILSPPAVYRAGGRAMLAFCDEQNLVQVDLAARSQAGRFNLGRSAVVTPIVGDMLGRGTAEIYTRTDTDGRGYLIETGLSWDPKWPPWSGLRGNGTRSLRLDKDFEAFRSAQLQHLSKRIEANLAEAKKLAAAGQWQAALDLINNGVLAASPYHNEALGLRDRYFLRANLLLIVLGSLVVLVLAGALSWIGFRHARAWTLNRLAARAIEKDRPEKAIIWLRRLTRDFPRHRGYAAKLARVYIRQKQFDSESAPAFERAHQFFPKEEHYLKALATAYSSVPRFDEQAAAVYKVMAKLSRKPGPWYFILGQALQETGQPREALDAYRLAIVHQYEDPRLPGCMTDLYIQLGITSPEIIPTLDRVLDEREDDSAFLRTYCRACQEARRYDDQAQQIALKLLELDPEAPAGHTILATRLLQSGRHKDAMRHAQQILQVNPSDPVGLRLLGACYAAERRLDETAMKIFAKALEANPDAPEILVAVSHGYIQQGRADDEAKDVYRKALVHYPQDETVLAQLATIAERDQDDELTVRTIEPLIAMGRRTRELMLQLANAYCRLGITEERTADVYREALVFQPDHATIQENLAAIYLRKGRTDLEAMQLFQKVHEHHPERVDIGLQLMRCLMAADLPERTIALGEELRALEASNTELQKLMAAVSERADQMETAISGYEQVLRDNPDDPEAVCALSSLYGRKRRSDNVAIEVYLKALQFKPDMVEAYLAAARAYATRDAFDHSIQMVKNMLTRCPGQINEAIGLVESLVESWPKELKLRWYLVDTLIFNGRLREARRHIVEILKIDPAQADPCLRALDKIVEKSPRDAAAHLERGRLLSTLQRDREARQALEQAHRFHPENEEICRELMGFYQRRLEEHDSPEMRFQLGRLAMRLDKYDLAISCFQATSRDYRWEGESLRNLARCFMAKGMLDLAMQELRRLPLEDDVKDLLYELGQRYEAVGDIQGAREVYKLIFAADITYKDVKGKLETLNEGHHDQMAAERTAIIQSLTDVANKRYDLLEELGRGAMGIVYKARDRELEEVVALKILPDSLVRNQEAVRRFRQEARSARRLAHPNIVRIHDIGEEQGRKYISMEFVEGTDLKLKLRAVSRKLPFADALRYSTQLADAMAYAHSIGIVHRDIKPANLMLTRDDQVKVTDFGIAKMMEREASAPDSTQVGAVVGTPLYMSPEQVRGEGVDNRADIYSMGIVMYEMAGGYPPFTEGDLSYQHLFVEPKPLSGVNEAFAAIVMKCLAKKPEDRWQSVEEIQEALREIKA